MNDEYYRELILDHARNRRNWGLLRKPDFDHAESNPLCGDHLHLTLTLDERRKIVNVGWEGSGCAISQAAASMLGESLVGTSLDDAQKMTRDEILELVGLNLTPNRMKCALLPLKVLIVGAQGLRKWEDLEDAGGA
jgi:nitrogen fixation protein NifU and related proteins